MRRREALAVFCSVAAWPLNGRAQPFQPARRIGLLHPAAPISAMTESSGPPYWRAFFEELRRLGWVEGQNLKIERFSGQGRADRLPDLAREMTRASLDVIFVPSASMGQLVQKAGDTPLIVFTEDPVAQGFATNLAKPGGNTTGVTVDPGLNLIAKHFEFLKAAVPRSSRIGFVAPRWHWESAFGRRLRAVATDIKVELVGSPLETGTDPSEYRQVMGAIAAQQADAVLVHGTAATLAQRELIVELCSQHRLPALYTFREFIDVGGLMAYSVDLSDMFRQAALQLVEVLGGKKAGDIPFVQPVRFDLILNLKTSKALGLDLPDFLLVQANEIIE